MCEVDSVNVPGRLPVFWMSTVPGTVSPGLRLVALNSALDELEPMLSVPAVKVFEGFAALAVKFAPHPTVMPTAAGDGGRGGGTARVRRGGGQTGHGAAPGGAGKGHEGRASPF